MEYASRKDYQIFLLQPNSDPLILWVPNVEEPVPVQNIPDFFVLVKMLVEEHLYFLFVYRAHLVWRHDNLISILIRPLGGNFIDGGDGRAVVVENSELRQVVRAHGASGIMVFALVALMEGQLHSLDMDWNSLLLRNRSSRPSFLIECGVAS